MGETMPQITERNYGLDVLKVISMAMVITLHILGHGGLLSNAPFASKRYYLLYFIEFFAFSAVNIYVLVSGYIGTDRYSYSSFFKVHLQVVFYSVFIPLIIAIRFSETLSLTNIWKGFFPVCSNTYWFYSAFFFVNLFKPFFNAFSAHLSVRNHCAFVLMVIVFIAIFSCFFDSNLLYLNYGYSVFWLTILYVLGGSLKQISRVHSFKSWKCLLLYLICVLTAFFYKFFSEKFLLPIVIDSNEMLNYLSPTSLIAAIAAVFGFSNLQIGSLRLKKVILTLSNLTFGVYLIHDHEMVRLLFITDRFVPLIHLYPIKMLLLIFMSVISIFSCCGFMEYGRLKLFNLIRISKLCQKGAILLERWTGFKGTA